MLDNFIILGLEFNCEIKTEEKYSTISLIEVMFEALKIDAILQRRNYLYTIVYKKRKPTEIWRTSL